MAAEVELDGGAVAAGQHQPVIGRVVDAGVGIAGDDDAGGDVAPGVVGGVLQRRQHPAEVDVLGVHLLLRRRALDQHRRLRIAERAADELAHAAEVGAEGGFDVGLAGQQVADHRHVVAVDLGEQQRRPAVELLHQAGDFEMRIDRRRVGLQAGRARPCGRAPSESACPAPNLKGSTHISGRGRTASAPGIIRHCGGTSMKTALSTLDAVTAEKLGRAAWLIAGWRCAASRRTSPSSGTPRRCR